MNRFKIAYLAVKKIEGVYSDDATDNGGETVFGIARKRNPNWYGWVLVDELKKKVMTTDELVSRLKKSSFILDEVEKFYKKNYWDVLLLDEVQEYDVAYELYDTAVNQGAGTAAKYLQRALNMLNDGGSLFADLSVDGKVGPMTIAAYKKYIATSNWNTRNKEQVVSTLVKTLNGLQFYKYMSIVERNPAQERFFFGWVNNRI